MSIKRSGKMSREEQFDFYWKEIFTGLAYNPIEFNTYRFDQSMSLPGKVNKLYDMFKQLALNNQEVMNYLKEFVETFDNKLYETLEDVLEVWLNDERLAVIIGQIGLNLETFKTEVNYRMSLLEQKDGLLEQQIQKLMKLKRLLVVMEQTLER